MSCLCAERKGALIKEAKGAAGRVRVSEAGGTGGGIGESGGREGEGGMGREVQAGERVVSSFKTTEGDRSGDSGDRQPVSWCTVG